MKHSHLLTLSLLFFCHTASSQDLTVLKSGSIKLDEFNKLDSIELTKKSLRVVRYTAYFVCGDESKKPADSVCRSVFTVTVNGNSLKDPEFLRVLRKYSPPFIIIFDDIKVMTPENIQRTIESPSVKVL